MKTISTRLWRFNYVTSAWSYDEVPYLDTVNQTSPHQYYTGLLPSRTYLAGIPWEGWIDKDGSPDPDADSRNRWIGLSADDPNIDSSFQDENSWLDLLTEQRLAKNLKLGVWINSLSKQVVLQEEQDLAHDDVGGITFPIYCLIESGDYDFGTPDSTKTVTRISVKAQSQLEDTSGDRVEFSVYISDRMGYRWKRPKTLRFALDYNEGHADFRATGSTFRFKLVNSQDIDPYRISEMVLRVIGRGLQITN